MGPRLTQRLTALCDPDSLEKGPDCPGLMFFLGSARINNRKVKIIAADPDPMTEPPDLAESLSLYIRTLQQAETESCPVVFLHDAPAPFESGRTAFQGSQVGLMMAENGIGRQYFEIARLATQVPLVGAVFGNMAQAQAFPVAMCHGLVMMEKASVSVARPDAVEAMLGEKVDYQNLGGARLHSRSTGICDQVVSDETAALDWVRDFLGYLPSNINECAPKMPAEPPLAGVPSLDKIIPTQLNQPFDARDVLDALVDQSEFLELGRHYAQEIITALARINGHAAGILANNPKVRGGVLFPETCRKMIRFIKFCDVFQIPLVFLADAPGFMIGKAVEKEGIVAAGAELFAAIAHSRVPRFTLILRRAYTAGMYAMSGSGFQPSALYALPGASIAVYGPEAVERFLEKLDLSTEEKEGIRKKMMDESRLETLVEQGLLTGVLSPDKVRDTLANFLEDCNRCKR